MTEQNKADGPGEALIDEPTEHALDPELEPNTEWEEAADPGSEDSEDSEDSDSSSEDTSSGTSEGTSEDES